MVVMLSSVLSLLRSLLEEKTDSRELCGDSVVSILPLLILDLFSLPSPSLLVLLPLLKSAYMQNLFVDMSVSVANHVT